MKKLLNTLAVLLILGAGALLKANDAEAHYVDPYYDDPNGHAHVCTNYSPLNVRYGPGTNYAIYTSFPKGTVVYYMDEGYAANGKLWYQVTDGYSYGWVYGGYICFY